MINTNLIMSFFKRRESVIDWTETYKPDRPLEREEDLDLGKLRSIQSSQTPQSSKPAQEQSPGFFGGFFGGETVSTPVSNSEDISPEERKRMLAKRLSDMTERIEDLSNQIYHLQNRIEVLEKKLGTNLGY